MPREENSSPPGAVYGINAVKEAIGVRPIDYVLVAAGQHSARVQEVVTACRNAGIPLRFSPRAALDRAAGTTHHQDVVAVCAAKQYDDLESLVAGREKPLLVALDGVEDPRNLGAIIRTAVAAGADGIVIPERRAAGLTASVAHVSR